MRVFYLQFLVPVRVIIHDMHIIPRQSLANTSPTVDVMETTIDTNPMMNARHSVLRMILTLLYTWLINAAFP